MMSTIRVVLFAVALGFVGRDAYAFLHHPTPPAPIIWHRGSGNGSAMGVSQAPDWGKTLSYAYGYMIVPAAPPPAPNLSIAPGVTYWIGIQSAATVDWIVQPSLNYGNHWDCGIENRWFILPYALYGNVTPQCGTILAVNPGDMVWFQISLLSGDGTTDVYRSWAGNGQTGEYVTLDSSVKHEATAFVAAQEWYEAVSCDSTPSTTMGAIELGESPIAPDGSVNPFFLQNVNLAFGVLSPSGATLDCPYATFVNYYGGNLEADVQWNY